MPSKDTSSLLPFVLFSPTLARDFISPSSEIVITCSKEGLDSGLYERHSLMSLHNSELYLLSLKLGIGVLVCCTLPPCPLKILTPMSRWNTVAPSDQISSCMVTCPSFTCCGDMNATSVFLELHSSPSLHTRSPPSRSIMLLFQR